MSADGSDAWASNDGSEPDVIYPDNATEPPASIDGEFGDLVPVGPITIVPEGGL